MSGQKNTPQRCSKTGILKMENQICRSTSEEMGPSHVTVNHWESPWIPCLDAPSTERHGSHVLQPCRLMLLCVSWGKSDRWTPFFLRNRTLCNWVYGCLPPFQELPWSVLIIPLPFKAFGLSVGWGHCRSCVCLEKWATTYCESAFFWQGASGRWSVCPTKCGSWKYWDALCVEGRAELGGTARVWPRYIVPRICFVSLRQIHRAVPLADCMTSGWFLFLCEKHWIHRVVVSSQWINVYKVLKSALAMALITNWNNQPFLAWVILSLFCFK